MIRESDKEENAELKRKFDPLLYANALHGNLAKIKAYTCGLVFGSAEFVRRFRE